MHIAHITFRFGAPGGVEHQVHQLGKELIRMGHEVEVITSDVYSEEPWKKFNSKNNELDGIKIRRFKAYRNIFPMLRSPVIPDLISALIDCDADIIHAHSHRYMHLPMTSLVHRVIKVPFIVTTHFHPPEMRETLKNRILLRIGDILFKHEVYRYATKVITKTELEKEYLRGIVPREKCVAIPDGISIDDWEGVQNDEKFRDKYGIEGRYILYAGRLARNKGLRYLIAAIPNVLKKHDVKFVFVGEDWGELSSLKRMVDDLNISENVLFTGYIEDYEIYKSAFFGCEIFVLPSEWEALGIVLIEAMYCKKAVIGTNVGGVPEVIDNGKNGLLVPFADVKSLSNAITSLLSNDALRKEFGENGKKKVLENYLWSKVAKKLEKVYIEAINSRGGKILF